MTEKFKEKKERTLPIVQSYLRLSNTTSDEVKSEYYFKKGKSISTCGDHLQFYKYKESGVLKLFHANFCRNRLCPMCVWRKSLKVFGQTSQIISHLEEKKYRYLFLTLTLKNCDGDQLSETIDEMFIAIKKFFKRKQLKVVKGFFRALEVTYSKTEKNFHPHFHLILAVPQSYFKKSNQYIEHKDFVQLWQESLNCDYAPKVNIKAIEVCDSKTVAEVSKYPVKDSDIVVEGDEPLTDKILSVLDSALKGRRLVAYGRDFAKAKKELDLDDIENGSLVDTNSQDDPAGIIDCIVEMRWKVGFGDYEIIEKPYNK